MRNTIKTLKNNIGIVCSNKNTHHMLSVLLDNENGAAIRSKSTEKFTLNISPQIRGKQSKLGRTYLHKMVNMQDFL